MPTFDQARLDRLELAVRHLDETARVVADRVAMLDQRSRSIAASAPFLAPTSSGGPAVVRLAISSGAITASSPTAPGSGYATPIAYDPGMAAYVATGSAIAVLNAGVAASSGVRGFLLADQDGAVWFTPEECG